MSRTVADALIEVLEQIRVTEKQSLLSPEADGCASFACFAHYKTLHSTAVLTELGL